MKSTYTATAASRIGKNFARPGEVLSDDVLGTLLELALSFLQDCLAGRGDAESVIVEALKPSWRTRLALRLRARRLGLPPGRTVDALLTSAAESTESEITGFVAEHL